MVGSFLETRVAYPSHLGTPSFLGIRTSLVFSRSSFRISSPFLPLFFVKHCFPLSSFQVATTLVPQPRAQLFDHIVIFYHASFSLRFPSDFFFFPLFFFLTPPGGVVHSDTSHYTNSPTLALITVYIPRPCYSAALLKMICWIFPPCSKSTILFL